MVAQSIRISGTVQDQSGALIPNAGVTLRKEADTKTTLTDGGGSFSFDGLGAGTYDVQVDQPGFKTATAHVVVTTRNPRPIEFKLQIAELRQELTVAGVPAANQSMITSGFQACFDARAHAKDPSAVPPVCAATAREISASPAPAPVKAKVENAVLAHAIPAARLDDFTRSMRVTLWWQIAAFAIALALSARLPRVRLDADATMAAAA